MIVRLAGGLGNQIFQFGAALYLSRIRKQKKIYLDSSALSLYQVKRELELNDFFDLNKSNTLIKSNFLTRIRLPVHLALPFVYWPLVGDQNFSYVKKCASSFPVLMDGYFQTCLNQCDFDNIANELKKVFSVKLDKKKKNTCVVHIRGGDFVDLGWNELTPEKYYFEAISLMKDTVKIDRFIVVTDDINYAKSIITSCDEFDIVFQSRNLREDFKTIASYPYRILSASTFSLWASVLGENRNGLVIAPKEFTPGVYRNFLLPNEYR